jgi:hypothetical protein
MYRQMIRKVQSYGILAHKILDDKRPILLGCQLIRQLSTILMIREQGLIARKVTSN